MTVRRKDPAPPTMARPSSNPSTGQRGPVNVRAQVPAADPSLRPGDYVVPLAGNRRVGRVMGMWVPNGVEVYVANSGRGGPALVVGAAGPDVGIVRWRDTGDTTQNRWAAMYGVGLAGHPHVVAVRWTGEARDAAVPLVQLGLLSRARGVVLNPRDEAPPPEAAPRGNDIVLLPNLYDLNFGRIAANRRPNNAIANAGMGKPDPTGLINTAIRRAAAPPPPAAKKAGGGAGFLLGGGLLLGLLAFGK